MNERVEKIKTHMKENKKLYIGIGVGVGLAVAIKTLPIMRDRHAALLRGADGLKTADASVTMRPLFFFSSNNKIVTTIHTGERGHPGFRVRNLEKGLEFKSQGEAAAAFGISPSNLSSHLNGKFDEVEGLHFERIVV